MTDSAAPAAAPPALSAGLTVLLAAACGLIAADLYYAQTLAGLIRVDLGLSAQATGLIVTLTQIGYGLGLLLIAPLADLVENRRLVLIMVGVVCLAVLAAGAASTAWMFLTAALFIGIGAVAVQILVPYAAHLSPDATRGRAAGNVMSGLMLGIMLARPAASFLVAAISWRGVFFMAAGVMLVLGLVLSRALPRRVPVATFTYGQMLASMGRLMLTTPLLRRRALYQACQFGAFSLFWTTTPLLLMGPRFHLNQTGVALFALAGVAGAIASPIAGRVADRGWSQPATALALLCVAAAYGLTHLVGDGSPLALGLFVAAAILLDFGVSANLTLGQRAIFALGPEVRGRLNGLYMATFFAGGALGSALGGWAFAQGGWALASAIGAALPVIGLIYFATEFVGKRRTA